ncbi:MAG: DUF3962 domain-containing protein [Hormoscilla sp.]
MPSYDQLRTLSFRLPEGKPLKPQTFQILKFPEKWKSELRNLQAEITGRSVDKTNVPISSLNKALRALVPDLIYITPYAAKSNVQPWLYSAMPIDIQALYLIFNAWVKTQFKKASEKRITALLKKLPVEDLQWEPTKLNVGSWTTADNGTAELGGDNSFILLPHVLAAKLSQDDISIEFGPNILRFRRAPLFIGSKGAELVSWPPLDYADKRGSWYWSVVITFTLQTVPFQSFPVLHCDLSLRRWGSMPIEFLPSDKETNVYLLTEVPWLKNLPYSNSFQVAPIRSEKVPASEGHKDKSEYRVTWGSNLVPLLDWLKVGDRFPTPQNIKDNPESTLNLNNDNPTAALVFRYGINPKHGVGPGLSPADRRQLAEQIAKLIAPEWEFVELLQRVKFKSEVPTNIFLPDSKAKKKTKISEFNALRVRAIRQAVGDSLTLEIWYQNEAKRAGLINAIRESLGIPDSASFPYEFADLDFTLNLRYQPLGALGDKLEIDSGIKDEKDRRRQAIRKRGKEVAEKIEKIEQASAPLAQSKVTAALIELDGADRKDFANNADPKYALRRGFALCDRVTQFISTELDKLSHRATSSFLDLLRQLEVQPACPNIVIKKHSLPDKINYVGLWLVKHNSPTSADGSTQRVPVMVYMASDTTEIKAIAPGFDNQWLPYREALLKIGKEEVKGFKRPEEAMLKFIKPKLHDVIYQDRSPKDTVLFCHAQNTRHAWKWLNNGNIALDMVFLGKEKPQPINRYFPGLRIVRIRDSQSHETPEWYAQNKLLAEKDKEQGWAQGIFKMGDRVFASTYNKPKQFQNLSPKQSKVSPWTTVNKTTKEEHVHAPSPDTYVWNPGLVELTVACLQSGDDPFPWVALTHELRHIALQYDEPLKLPLPLHLAKQIEEYVLLMENEDIEDE